MFISYIIIITIFIERKIQASLSQRRCRIARRGTWLTGVGFVLFCVPLGQWIGRREEGRKNGRGVEEGGTAEKGRRQGGMGTKAGRVRG